MKFFASLAVMFMAALAGASVAAAPPPSKAILTELETIPSVGESNILMRIKQCGIRVDAESFSDTLAADNLKTGDLRGDLMIWVVIDVPPPDGWKGTKSKYAGLTAGWRKREGKYVALTEWARNLQSVAAPMDWLKC